MPANDLPGSKSLSKNAGLNYASSEKEAVGVGEREEMQGLSSRVYRHDACVRHKGLDSQLREDPRGSA